MKRNWNTCGMICWSWLKLRKINPPPATFDEISTADDVDDQEVEGVLEQLVGMRCSAPYGRSCGHQLPLKNHSSVILEVLGDTTDLTSPSDLAQLQVKVLYCYPMYQAMVPCRFFLEEKCTFGDSCKFSHGEIVQFEDLMEYIEPDYQTLSEHSKCLAKSSDGLWKLAEVTSVCLQKEQVAVRLIQSDQEIALAFHDVLPICLPSDVTSPSPTQESFTDRHQITVDDEQSAKAAIQPSGSDLYQSGPIGDWEKHTKGVASRLMAKMGYVFGEGLGKDSAGRINPIEAQILPKGKSLDHYMELKEKQNEKDPLKTVKKQRKKKKLKEKRLLEGRLHNATEHGIFDFLNRKLSLHVSNEERHAVLRKIGQHGEKDIAKPTCSKSVNVQLYELHKSAGEIEKSVQRYKVALGRNQGKDSVIAKQLKEKMSSAKRNLQNLRAQETKLQAEQSSQKEKKKLAIF